MWPASDNILFVLLYYCSLKDDHDKEQKYDLIT